jgi:sugar lactone lactonase YvrE
MTPVRAVVAARDTLGETPLWCVETQRLWWLDVDRPAVQRWDPQTNRHDVFALSGRGAVGALALRRAGGLLIARDRALHIFDPETGALAPVATVEPDGSDTRLNDGRCDAAGRFWVGGLDNALHRPIAGFYRVDPDGTVTRQFGDVIVTNSVAIAPDQRTLYMADTRRFVLWAFDLDPVSGSLSNRRVFVDHRATGERPDGACVDADGHVWNAIFAGGRVVRYAPDGTVARTIALPVTNPTCLCLGGPDLRTLYITTARKFLSDAQLAAEPLAGAVLAVDVDVPGLPEARFGG